MFLGEASILAQATHTLIRRFSKSSVNDEMSSTSLNISPWPPATPVTPRSSNSAKTASRFLFPEFGSFGGKRSRSIAAVDLTLEKKDKGTQTLLRMSNLSDFTTKDLEDFDDSEGADNVFLDEKKPGEMKSSTDTLDRISETSERKSEEMEETLPQGITHKLDEQFVKHQVSEYSMEWNPNVELSSACATHTEPNSPSEVQNDEDGSRKGALEDSDTVMIPNEGQDASKPDDKIPDDANEAPQKCDSRGTNEEEIVTDKNTPSFDDIDKETDKEMDTNSTATVTNDPRKEDVSPILQADKKQPEDNVFEHNEDLEQRESSTLAEPETDSQTSGELDVVLEVTTEQQVPQLTVDEPAESAQSSESHLRSEQMDDNISRRTSVSEIPSEGDSDSHNSETEQTEALHPSNAKKSISTRSSVSSMTSSKSHGSEDSDGSKNSGSEDNNLEESVSNNEDQSDVSHIGPDNAVLIEKAKKEHQKLNDSGFLETEEIEEDRVEALKDVSGQSADNTAAPLSKDDSDESNHDCESRQVLEEILHHLSENEQSHDDDATSQHVKDGAVHEESPCHQEEDDIASTVEQLLHDISREESQCDEQGHIEQPANDDAIVLKEELELSKESNIQGGSNHQEDVEDKDIIETLDNLLQEVASQGSASEESSVHELQQCENDMLTVEAVLEDLVTSTVDSSDEYQEELHENLDPQGKRETVKSSPDDQSPRIDAAVEPNILSHKEQETAVEQILDETVEAGFTNEHGDDELQLDHSRSVEDFHKGALEDNQNSESNSHECLSETEKGMDVEQQLLDSQADSCESSRENNSTHSSEDSIHSVSFPTDLELKPEVEEELDDNSEVNNGLDGLLHEKIHKTPCEIERFSHESSRNSKTSVDEPEQYAETRKDIPSDEISHISAEDDNSNWTENQADGLNDDNQSICSDASLDIFEKLEEACMDRKRDSDTENTEPRANDPSDEVTSAALEEFKQNFLEKEAALKKIHEELMSEETSFREDYQNEQIGTITAEEHTDNVEQGSIDDNKTKVSPEEADIQHILLPDIIKSQDVKYATEHTIEELETVSVIDQEVSDEALASESVVSEAVDHNEAVLLGEVSEVEIFEAENVGERVEENSCQEEEDISHPEEQHSPIATSDDTMEQSPESESDIPLINFEEESSNVPNCAAIGETFYKEVQLEVQNHDMPLSDDGTQLKHLEDEKLVLSPEDSEVCEIKEKDASEPSLDESRNLDEQESAAELCEDQQSETLSDGTIVDDRTINNSKSDGSSHSQSVTSDRDCVKSLADEIREADAKLQAETKPLIEKLKLDRPKKLILDHNKPSEAHLAKLKPPSSRTVDEYNIPSARAQSDEFLMEYIETVEMVNSICRRSVSSSASREILRQILRTVQHLPHMVDRNREAEFRILACEVLKYAAYISVKVQVFQAIADYGVSEALYQIQDMFRQTAADLLIAGDLVDQADRLIFGTNLYENPSREEPLANSLSVTMEDLHRLFWEMSKTGDPDRMRQALRKNKKRNWIITALTSGAAVTLAGVTKKPGLLFLGMGASYFLWSNHQISQLLTELRMLDELKEDLRKGTEKVNWAINETSASEHEAFEELGKLKRSVSCF